MDLPLIEPPAGLGLAKLDELLDVVPEAGPKYLLVPEGFTETFHAIGRAHDLGYSLKAYQRELAALGAFHGPRLAWRLEVAMLDQVLARRMAAACPGSIVVSTPTGPDGLQP